MAGLKHNRTATPTPGPWLVRGEAEPGAPPAEVILGVEPAMADRPSGWPYFVRPNHPVARGGCPLHIATGIQRLADARLIAAAPDLAALLLQVLTAPACTAEGLDGHTRAAVEAGWAVLVRAAPHLEVWP